MGIIIGGKMYYSLDLSIFGNQIRTIRETLKLSRVKVHNITGISVETLRRIEKGDVIPQIATLTILSQIYKVDVIDIFNNIKGDNLILNIHNIIDQIILKIPYYTESLDQYIISNDDLKTCNYVYQMEVEQFNLILEMLPISKNFSNDSKNFVINSFMESLKKTHTNFSFTSIDNYTYTFIELRILLICGVLFAENKKYDISNKILYFLLDQLQVSERITPLIRELYIKVLCNIAYNNHSLDKHETVILICDKAIEYLNKYNSNYLLESILYRKGIAQFLLNLDGYKKTLSHSKAILEIKSFKKQLENYTNVTKRNYNIDF